MNRTLRHLALASVAVLAVLAPASAASAADASGCTLTVASTSADGKPLDTASAPGDGGTEAHPFQVDLGGKVAYEGKTDAVITDGTYTVTALGVTVKTDTVTNADKKQTAKGEVDLSTVQSLKPLLSGGVKIPVQGTLTGTGGSCTVSGYITGVGSATSSPVFYAGLAAAAIGLGLALWTLFGTKATVVASSAAGGAS